jgi:hypothetical protein
MSANESSESFHNGPPPNSVWEVETRLHEEPFDVALFIAPSASAVVEQVGEYWKFRYRYRSDIQGSIWIARVTYIGPVLTKDA